MEAGGLLKKVTAELNASSLILQTKHKLLSRLLRTLSISTIHRICKLNSMSFKVWEVSLLVMPAQSNNLTLRSAPNIIL